MRILVLQMTRMGDTIQTSPLISAIRQQDPEAHITIVVRPMGVAAADRIVGVDEVISMDEDAVFSDLCSGDSERLLAAYCDTDATIRKIRDGRFDIAYNCTHSIGSAMLLKMAEIPKVVGAHLSDDWRFVIRGAWSNYFFASAAHRAYNNLNLCDVLRHFVSESPAPTELSFQTTDEEHRRAEQILNEGGSEQRTRYICMQLGASDEYKRWPVEEFATLAKEINRAHNIHSLLLGVESEAPLGREFEACAPGVSKPLFGKTTLGEMAAVLKGARCLVTNDTGTMHVAAAVGCPVVLLSVGYAHFRETGPYGTGHWALQRRRSPFSIPHIQSTEHDAEISAKQVLPVVERALGMAQAEAFSSVDYEDVEVFSSDYAPDGCLEWYPAMKNALTEWDILRIAYRVTWLHLLEGLTSDSEESVARLISSYECPSESAEWEAKFQSDIDELRSLMKEGEQICKQILTALKSVNRKPEAETQLDKLLVLDERIRLLGELRYSLKPLVAVYTFDRDNLEGEEAGALAQATRDNYLKSALRLDSQSHSLHTVQRCCAAQARAESIP